MALRIRPLWPAIPGGHSSGRRYATLKMAPGRFLAVWLMFSLVPAVSLAQTPGDRDLIRERLLQAQQYSLDEQLHKLFLIVNVFSLVDHVSQAL
ncbi:MAG: hypothetical protein KKF24_09020 [Gammaproteobacteria bacterium]|uniref:hypothetical protein n=1 Tax=Pseudomonas sp. FEMGT703P TaxID=2080764 RepID=UPI001DF90F26|nr:hypothetical protein [Pseudomonas sp. FEMGT703P]MBU0538615.1 hypothetical protein [Gammaproteobacteria bacterium]MBU1832822.1 hypothetical protein [Gammaproteobacteria bacterium]